MEWKTIDSAPYEKSVLVWVHLPKNPKASWYAIGTRDFVEEDEPEEYAEQRRTVGCWWVNGRYYHRKGYTADNGFVSHWMPLPEPPSKEA